MRGGGILLFLTVVLALAPQWWAAPVALLLALAVTAAVDRAVLRAALGLGLLLGVVFAAAVAGAVVAWHLGPARGLVAGGDLLCRLLVLWLATGYMARRVDADAVVAAARRAGFEALALVFGLALNALPRLVAAAQEVWIAHRVRHRTRLAAWRHASAMAEVLLAHTARLGDDAAAAAALRGHAALLYPRVSRIAARIPAVVVTGRSGGGKTPVVEAAAAQLKYCGVAIAGVVQPAVFTAGDKSGFRVRNLADGREALLARRVERGEGEHGTRFAFLPEGLHLAQDALASAPVGAVLVVDELGPVELRGEGHMPALQRTIRRRRPTVLVLVVRRHLIPALVASLDAAEVTVIDVDTSGDPAAELVAAVTRLL